MKTVGNVKVGSKVYSIQSLFYDDLSFNVRIYEVVSKKVNVERNMCGLKKSTTDLELRLISINTTNFEYLNHKTHKIILSNKTTEKVHGETFFFDTDYFKKHIKFLKQKAIRFVKEITIMEEKL